MWSTPRFTIWLFSHFRLAHFLPFWFFKGIIYCRRRRMVADCTPLFWDIGTCRAKKTKLTRSKRIRDVNFICSIGGRTQMHTIRRVVLSLAHYLRVIIHWCVFWTQCAHVTRVEQRKKKLKTINFHWNILAYKIMRKTRTKDGPINKSSRFSSKLDVNG